MFNNFNEEEIDLYEKIGQKVKIRKEIEGIDEQIEILKVKQDIEQIPMDDEIKKLAERKDLLSEEEKEVGNSDEYVLIIGKLDSIKSLKKKLAKLEEKKATIAGNIYDKLKQEYINEYKKNELILLKETEKITKLQDEVNTFLQNVNLIREEEEIRFGLSEYSESEYKVLIERLDLKEKKAEAILYATSVLIEEFKDELK